MSSSKSPGVDPGRVPFAIRGIHLCESLSRHTPAQLQRILGRLVEWRLNTFVVIPHYGFRRHESLIRDFCREHQIRLIQYTYSFLDFAAGAPPEMFARDASGRPVSAVMGCETRLCASLPAARRFFREGARRHLNEHVTPGDQLILATADGLQMCACEKCRALDPMEQWQPFLEIAVEEILRSGKPVTTHFIAYVGRFRLPKRMDIFEKIDCVMFDTHLRHRWLPLGSSHAIGPAEAIEGRYDPAALETPVNVYLLERLKEWRGAYRGKLYVFENLMIQSTMSLPQPNTRALLHDQETFRSLGMDGIVYEAFEPGIGAFEEQLACLSRGMMGETVDYVPDALEKIATGIRDARDIRLRALQYLFTPECQCPEDLSRLLSDPVLASLAAHVRDYLPAPTFQKWARLAGFALKHRDQLDWIYILYRMATYLPPEERPENLTTEQERLFATPKPWDFLAHLDDPQTEMLRLFRSLAEKRPIQR